MSKAKEAAIVLGVPLAASSLEDAVSQVMDLAHSSSGKYICFVDAHLLVRARDSAELGRALKEAALRFPDGTPVNWCVRLSHPNASCIRGPEAMPALFERAQTCGVRVGFYGGSPETLLLMRDRLHVEYPRLRVDYLYSPPFREMNADERNAVLDDIKSSGIKLLFVGLGCPKQELWMLQNASQLPCVSLGVGAAFRIFTRETHLPPTWVMNAGLTWATRLAQEPKRLFKRVFIYLPRFATLVAADLMLGLRPGPKSTFE